MTKQTEHDALHDQLERAIRASRNCGGADFLSDFDDLAPSRPIVWLVLAYVCIIIAVALLLFYPRAAQSNELWLSVNTVSWHNQRDCVNCPDGQVNGANWGGGLEARFDHGLVAMAGGYRNSFSRGTAYVLGAWQPVEVGYAKAGFFAGAVTGYRNEEDCRSTVCPAAGLMFSVQRERVGINVMVVPAVSPKHTTVVGLQVKARLI